MRVTTSLWTTPMKNNRWDIDYNTQFKNTILMCALCVEYAKRSGFYITMHTDSTGYEVLKELNYDEIYADLDILDEKIKTNPTILWAGGKAIALDKEPLRTIHIDNDVFLMKPDIIDEMDFGDADFIFQHVEVSEYKEKEIFRHILTNINMDKKFACCVGIIGFNSEKAKEQYLNNYKYWFDNLKFDKTSNYTNADLILEQLYLYNMMDDMGYKGKALLGDLRSNEMWEISQKAIKMGYEHVIGYTKFDEYVLEGLNKRLKRLNPKIYEFVQSL